MHPLLDRFEKLVATQPTRLAAGDQSLALDYQSFRAVAGGLSQQIAAATQAPRVGILAPTSTACAAAIFAAWYANKVPVPLNFLLAPDELIRVVRDAGIDTIATIERFAPALAGTPLKVMLLNAQSLVPGAALAPAAQHSDLGVLLYTSGTSAEPKGVELTFDNLLQNSLGSIEHAKMTPDQVFLSVLPQFHSFGFTAMTVLPLILGASVLYMPRFSPVAIVQTIQEKHVTIFAAVASMFGALSHMKTTAADAYRNLKLAISGGEPLPLRVAQAFEERFGVRICEGYGLTETSPVVSINLPDAYQAGSVGRAIPGVTVTARDEKGQPVPAGKDGELFISGHCVMRGYHNKPDQTAAVLQNGEFRTGDIGRIDADGFIYITGRAKEMLIIGGENVYPREIENVITDHPAVAEAAVIGAKDDMRGEVPVAFVILKDGASATDADIRDFCRDKLANYKVPREVRVMTDLPRSPTGKILKRALKV